MLIVNADDWGRDLVATETALRCYKEGRISSVSAMVFMEDSQRAADLANASNLDVGLHVNLTEAFSDIKCPKRTVAQQQSVRRFLKASKYALLVYQPFLLKHFRQLFEAQLAEFRRVYGRNPSHFDGHQHMHLSTNMVVQRVIPAGEKVRRSFSFRSGEKSLVNRLYRRAIDHALARRYRITDFFFALSQHLLPEQLAPLFVLAREQHVEIMTHTWNQPEYQCLLGERFGQLSARVELRGYSSL